MLTAWCKTIESTVETPIRGYRAVLESGEAQEAAFSLAE